MSEAAKPGAVEAGALFRKPLARRLVWLAAIGVLLGWAATQPNPPPEPVGWTGWTGA